MQLTKFMVIVLVFITKRCLAEIMIETSEPDESGLVEATVNILESCYIDRVDTVGLAGASAGSISKTSSFREIIIPVTLVDDTSMVVNNRPVNPESRYKLQVFVVTITDSGNLTKTLIQIKNSVWWNHMAFFLLLDWPVSKNECSNAYEVLWEAWTMNLLNSKFMCLHRTRGRLIYTYNPYTSKAPVPWQLENTYKGTNDHIWTLFTRIYRKDNKICDALDFDKTIDLGGYEIRASIKGSESWWYEDPKIKPTFFNRVENISAQTVMSSLNVTWKFMLYNENDAISVDEEGKPYGEVADIINGVSDIAFNLMNQYSSINYTATYPHLKMDLTVITQYRGHMSQLSKIASVLDKSSHIGLLLTCLITLLFFKFFQRESLMSAVLNVTRIACNSALLKISNKVAPRIYLGSLFIFTLTIQGIYQGKLASLLTKQTPLPNVNTINDLVHFGHTIYGNKNYFSCFNELDFEGRFIGLNIFNCTFYVLRDSNAACAGTEYQLISEAAQFQLHLSHKMMNIYMVYLIRSDWPLEDRINTNYRRFMEGGIMRPMLRRELYSTKYILESHKNKYNDELFKEIIFEELNFAFIILGIGLGCAIVSFIIEITIDRLRIVKSRKFIRRRIK